MPKHNRASTGTLWGSLDNLKREIEKEEALVDKIVKPKPPEQMVIRKSHSL